MYDLDDYCEGEIDKGDWAMQRGEPEGAYGYYIRIARESQAPQHWRARAREGAIRAQMAMGKSYEEAERMVSGEGKGSGVCFIATAAYGTPHAPQVALLRIFRDTRLKQGRLGRAFVAVYERLSPPLAAVIAHHPWLRALARWLVIAPAVWIAKRFVPYADESHR